ncbi:DUF1189 domain-containing protein [Gottfriedia acidiceleris]|uniref:DUF1189 domain-containing protein n=1 Tax=Gottfriedia acidiceleris TaxID=371036 RepID=A0ABY4JP89_9BACI|nr:DUF1189 domain-containing protein [Gottfriedia acidiceleris]UPM55663.1 DUF1189 domain-containing protein [Gottfriedia acidiceleris]
MNIFKQFWFSLYSPKTILRFRLQKIGKTIFFLFLLAILYTLPGFFSLVKDVKLQVNNFSDLLKDNVQTISLSKGSITINDNTPFERNIGEYKYAFYPNETVIPTKLKNEQYAFVVLKNRIIMKNDKGEQDFPYPSLKSGVINKAKVTKFIENIKEALPVVLIALFFLFYLGYSIFIFIVATLLAFLTALFKSTKHLPFRQRFAIVSYSLTLPTVIYLLLGLLKINILFQTLIFILITVAMFTLTIKNLPSKK